MAKRVRVKIPTIRYRVAKDCKSPRLCRAIIREMNAGEPGKPSLELYAKLCGPCRMRVIYVQLKALERALDRLEIKAGK